MKATKDDIINAVAKYSRLNKHQIKITLNLILDNMQRLLVEHGQIEMRGFGTFNTRVRSARDNARNPRTGTRISLKERRVVFFKPGKMLRRLLSSSDTSSAANTTDTVNTKDTVDTKDTIENSDK